MEERKANEDEIETDCNVCFNTMVEPCTLPCAHSFCVFCIRKAMEAGRVCPMCRAEVSEELDLVVDGEL